MMKKNNLVAKFDVNKFALAAGFTFVILFIIMHVFGWTMHASGWMKSCEWAQRGSNGMMMGYAAKGGMAKMGAGGWSYFIFIGSLIAFLCAYLGGWIFAWMYNQFVEEK